MKIRNLLVAFLLAPQTIFATEMLYRQSFETPIDQNPEIEWISPGYPLSQKITDHMPKDGIFSVRGNFNSSVTDPIINMKGDPFTHFKIYFKDIPKVKNWYKTADKVYVSWWWKLDKCKWRGTALTDKNADLDDPIFATGKYAYIRMNEDPTTSYYFTMRGGENGVGVLAVNNDTWMKIWQEQYKGSALWLQNNKPHGSDGLWHKLSFLIEKNSKGEKYMTWWMDDALMRKDTLEPTGKFAIYKDFVMDSIQFWITKDTDINQSIESGSIGNHCNGWQIDDVQVWDGVPLKPVAPKREPNKSAASQSSTGS